MIFNKEHLVLKCRVYIPPLRGGQGVFFSEWYILCWKSPYVTLYKAMGGGWTAEDVERTAANDTE